MFRKGVLKDMVTDVRTQIESSINIRARTRLKSSTQSIEQTSMSIKLIAEVDRCTGTLFQK